MITYDGIAGLSNCQVPSRLRSPFSTVSRRQLKKEGSKMKSERIMDKLAWVAMILCLVLALILTFR